MYIKENSGQMTLKGFYAPFAERLSPENRWVKLSKKMPWDRIEEEYLKNNLYYSLYRYIESKGSTYNK